jgi:hypothetical protein
MRDNASRVSLREFSQLQDQLIQVLANRLVELADRLSVLDECIPKENLIRSAKKQWHLPASFVWTDSAIPLPSNISIDGEKSYEVRSLCWKGFEPEDQWESSYGESRNPEQDETGMDDWTSRSTVSASPFLPEINDVPSGLFANVAMDTTTCKRCDAVVPDGIYDGL